MTKTDHHSAGTLGPMGGGLARMRRWPPLIAVLAASLFLPFSLFAAPAQAAETVPGFPVSGSVSVGSGPRTLAVSPDGERLYVGGDSRSLAVVDTQSRTLLKQVTLGAGPGGLMSVTAPSWFDGVVVFGFFERGFVYLVNGQTLEVERVLRMNPPFGVAVHPSLPLIYSVSQREPIIEVIDANSNAVVGRIPIGGSLGSGLLGLRISPDGSQLMWKLGNRIFIADTASFSITRSFDISVGGGDFNYSPNRDWTELAVAPWTDVDDISIVSLTTGSIIQSLPTVDGPNRGTTRASGLMSLLVTPDNEYVVSVAVGGTMFVRETRRPKRSIATSVAPDLTSLTAAPSGASMWGVSGSNNAVYEFNLDPAKPGRLVVVAEGVPGGTTVTWGSRGGAWTPGTARVTAVASPGGRSCSSEGSACTIAGLDRGKGYSIRVWAENVTGKGSVTRTRVRVPDVKPPRLPVPALPESKPEQDIS